MSVPADGTDRANLNAARERDNPGLGPLRAWERWEVWFLGLVLLAGAVLETDGQWVYVRGHPELRLPEACASRRWLGWNCPLCGATRSTLLLLQGRLEAAWTAHRLGWLCLMVIVATALTAVIPGRGRQVGLSERFTYGCWAATFVLLLANRVLDLFQS